MTGPEHYAEAEGQLKWVEGSTSITDSEAQIALGLAQAHATLALAAATAEAGNLVRWDDKQGPTEWQQVIYP